MSRRGMISILRCDGSDFDFVEHFPLQRAHLVQPDQFEQCQKLDHDLNSRHDLAEQLGKSDGRPIGDAFEDFLDLFRNGESFAKDFSQILSGFDAFDHFLKSVDQLENSNLVQRQWRIESRRTAAIACKDSLLLERAIVQLHGRFLELFVFNQLTDQVPARIVFVDILFGRLLIEREQAPAFEINQIRRHDDELARDVDLQLLERLQIFQVLLGNAFDRDFVNIDLVAFDQVKKEIERALENLELNFVIGLHPFDEL